MKTQPTPGPWSVTTTEHQQPGYPYAIIQFAEPWNEVVSAHVRSKEDAEHIVRCVNAAPKAIAALEDCIKWLSVGQRPQCKAETLEDLIRNTAAALAELKGE